MGQGHAQAVVAQFVQAKGQPGSQSVQLKGGVGVAGKNQAATSEIVKGLDMGSAFLGGRSAQGQSKKETTDTASPVQEGKVARVLRKGTRRCHPDGTDP